MKISHDDIDSLFKLVYIGADAAPTPSIDNFMPQEEYNARILDMNWNMMEYNTKKTMRTGLKHWIEYTRLHNIDAIVHPIPKVVQFLDWLRERMISRNSKDPSGTVENAKTALNHLRICQVGIPSPENFIHHPLMRHTSALARRATTSFRTSNENDILSKGFGATSFTKDEWQRLLETCVTYKDKFIGTTTALMISIGTMGGFRADDLCGLRLCTMALNVLDEVQPTPMEIVHLALNEGKTNKEGLIRYSGFARHKNPLLDAQSYLADKILYDLHIAKIPVLEMITQGDTEWRNMRIIYKHPGVAFKRAKYDDLYQNFTTIMMAMEDPLQKTKALHLFRDSGVIWLAQLGVPLDVIRLWGHWVSGVMGGHYIEKNPLAALEAYASLSGWGKDFYSTHYL
jgi:hypothetical protein